MNPPVFACPLAPERGDSGRLQGGKGGLLQTDVVVRLTSNGPR